MRILSASSIFFVILIVVSAFVIIPKWRSPVKGSVNPSNSGIRAWVFSKTDTFSTAITISGFFQIENVKEGSYTLMIEGRPPYRDLFKYGVVVVDEQPTDVGVIDMHQ